MYHLVPGTTNLLALLQPIMLMVCNNPARFPDPKLQSAASLAMAKYMTVRQVSIKHERLKVTRNKVACEFLVIICISEHIQGVSKKGVRKILHDIVLHNVLIMKCNYLLFTY